MKSGGGECLDATGGEPLRSSILTTGPHAGCMRGPVDGSLMRFGRDRVRGEVTAMVILVALMLMSGSAVI